MDRLKEGISKFENVKRPDADTLYHFLLLPYLFFIGFYSTGGTSDVPRSAYRVLYFAVFFAYTWNCYSIWIASKSFLKLGLYVLVPVPILILIVFIATRIGSGDILSDLEKKKPSFGI